MATVNVSSLLGNSFDWQSMVDKLIEVDSAPKKKLEAEQEANTSRIAALTEIRNAMFDFQGTVQSMWNSDLYSARTVTSDVANTTWKANSAAGAALGTQVIAVSQLATTSRLQGASAIGATLTGGTLATLNTATAVTAGEFSINGKKIAVSTTDTLAQVLTAIGTATGGAVTATYDSGSDKLKLTSASPVMVGAANDTSNFLAALGLTNSATFADGTYTVASRASLGRVKPANPLETGGLRTAVTGSGSFSLNGVSIAYNAATDSLNDVLRRINSSSAGVKAAYDASGDRVTLTNTSTGDLGIAIGADTGGLLAALGLASGTTFSAGKNAEFTVNGGPTQYSASNTLDATALGLTGLSVTVASEGTQKLEITADPTALRSAIDTLVSKYNSLQTLIEGHTQVTVEGGTISSAVLSDNREVQAWGSQIRAYAFNAVSSATGSVRRLNDLGLDFDGSTGELQIKQPAKLSAALTEHPTDVAAFFQAGTTGFAARLHGYLTTATKAGSNTQSRLSQTNLKLDTQIADIQRRLDSQRELLSSAFQKMQDAQSKAQSQNTYLTNTFFKSSS